MKRKKVLVGLLLLAVALSLWLVFNPPGKFGWCRYALTTYGAIPRPVSDIQVRLDGSVRRVTKTHELSYEMIEWLLKPMPEVLIVATGWDGVTIPSDEIKNIKSCEVRILKNKEPLSLFNELKKAGLKVAIHVHSTC